MAQPSNLPANTGNPTTGDSSSWIKDELRQYTPELRAHYLEHFKKQIIESSHMRETFVLDNAGRIQNAQTRLEQATRALDQEEYDATSRLTEHDIKHNGLVKMRDTVAEVMSERGELKGNR